MSRPIRISLSPLQAEALHHHLREVATADHHLIDAIRAVSEAIASKRRSRGMVAANFAHPADVPRKSSKAAKRERRAAIREKVFARAEFDGIPRCEGPKWHILLGSGPDYRKVYGRCGALATDLAHAFGKGKGRMPESERNCMAYCRSCSTHETKNRPSAEFWWSFRMAFFLAHGFGAEAREAGKRLAFVVTRSGLPAAPKVRP